MLSLKANIKTPKADGRENISVSFTFREGKETNNWVYSHGFDMLRKKLVSQIFSFLFICYFK